MSTVVDTIPIWLAVPAAIILWALVIGMLIEEKKRRRGE